MSRLLFIHPVPSAMRARLARGSGWRLRHTSGTACCRHQDLLQSMAIRLSDITDIITAEIMIRMIK
ncbi:MAG: hypothetical protein LBO21_10960, partial [Synergistaceae bacterium]|nr:hypothetical protein [Synergistaceae bacterium]